MKKSQYIFSIFFLLLLTIVACTKEEEILDTIPPNGDNTYKPKPYILPRPTGWSNMKIPADNPLTVEGVQLGRKLFYDPILSLDNTVSCASCHKQEFAFNDNKKFSNGVGTGITTRNSMPLFNIGWVENFAPVINGRPYFFFWDGGATSLEAQVLGPITNPVEMNETLPNVLSKLNAHPEYPSLFKKAFGSDSITTKMLAQAIAQFERTLISSSAKIDRYLFNPVTGKLRDTSVFTPQEQRGFNVFNDEEKGDCFHCHNVSSPFSSDFQFHNNGHTSPDEGLMRITGNAEDRGKFRTPSLRNLVYTSPYMHDGRFNTLEEVVEFYNSGINYAFPTDPLLLKHPGGLNLTSQEKADLVAFLKTLTDSVFVTNPEFARP